MNTMTDIPSWLMPVEDPRYPRSKEHREVEEINFACVFERILEGLEEGKLITHMVKQYPVPIDMGKLLRWVRKDPERFQRFEEAKQNGMIVKEEELLSIAQGETGLEDVQRSKLQVDSIKWVMQAWDRKRYGDKQQIDTTITSIDMVEAMRRAEQMRLSRTGGLTVTQDGEVVDG